MNSLRDIEAKLFSENPVHLHRNSRTAAILCGEPVVKHPSWDHESVDIYYVHRQQFWNIKVEQTKSGSKLVTVPGMGRCHLDKFIVRKETDTYWDQHGRCVVKRPPLWEGDYTPIGKVDCNCGEGDGCDQCMSWMEKD